MSKELQIGKLNILINDDESCSFISNGCEIDSDGSPHSYHPENKGLDYNQNAKDEHGNWVGILTDKNNNPLVQNENDPAPGYYISTTSYQDKSYDSSNPLRYLNSEEIPYIVVSPILCRSVKAIVLGCKATLSYNGILVDCIAGDVGPSRPSKIEISMAAAKSLGIPNSPKNGGTDRNIQVNIFPGVQAVINGIAYNLQSL